MHKLVKIPFVVDKCSSYDSGYPPLDQLSKGWQSERFCIFPQILTFKFTEIWKLMKIQILIHHFKIPSRIEISLMNDGGVVSKLGAVINDIRIRYLFF
jgi:centrosomal protein CEP104